MLRDSRCCPSLQVPWHTYGYPAGRAWCIERRLIDGGSTVDAKNPLNAVGRMNHRLRPSRPVVPSCGADSRAASCCVVRLPLGTRVLVVGCARMRVSRARLYARSTSRTAANRHEPLPQKDATGVLACVCTATHVFFAACEAQPNGGYRPERQCVRGRRLSTSLCRAAASQSGDN
jgi:hypothetical protein